MQKPCLRGHILPFATFLLLWLSGCDELPGPKHVGTTTAACSSSSGSGAVQSSGTKGPESRIVPGQGDCPDAGSLLAASNLERRELHLGKVSYRVNDPKRINHRVISTLDAYEALQNDLSLKLPPVNFSQEQVVFGSVIDWNTCGLKLDPLRSVVIGGRAHLDFSAVTSYGGADCNQSCAAIEEQAFVVAIKRQGEQGPTICTRKRVHCQNR